MNTDSMILDSVAGSLLAHKKFAVFGERIEILLDSSASGGGVAVLTQSSPPGGGPPPHRHTHEDETFTVLEGEIETFDGASWHPLRRGEVFFAPRGRVHTFRNAGSSQSTLLVFVTPGGFEQYLEQLSPFSFPADADKIRALSEQFGIEFVS